MKLLALLVFLLLVSLVWGPASGLLHPDCRAVGVSVGRVPWPLWEW